MTVHSMPHAPRYSLLPQQMVRILGITYTVVRATSEGWLMLADGDYGFMQEFTNAEIAGFVARRQISSVKAAPGQPPSRGVTCVTALLSGKPAPVQDAAMRKLAWCEAFAELEAERRVRRTDASIGMATAEIESLAKDIRFKQRHPGKEKPDAKYTCDLQTAPSARTLRRWLSSYHEEQLAGLLEGTLSGQRGSTLPEPLQDLLKRETRAYMKFQGPTIKKIHESIETEVAALNEHRVKENLEALRAPSYETVRRYIHDRYDAFQIACARKGEMQARREFKPVGRGLEVFHPLQRVEIDEWTTDLHAISDWLSLDAILDEEDRERLGFDKSIHRWAITVALDSATRCILGVVISRNPGSHAALQLLKLILMDKTAHAHALGASQSWHMHGVPVLIATDNGTAFTSADFHMACADLGLTFQRTVAGQPQLRARIERFFRTIALQLIPDMPGATSSKLIGLAGVDPAKFAALTVEDFLQTLVIWLVDRYHHTGHTELGGESPAACWDRLVAQWGNGSLPEYEQIDWAVVLGTRLKRRLGRDGITVLNVRYHSPALARHYEKTGGCTLETRWLADDMGSIFVRLEDGWHVVPCMREMDDICRGVTAIEWRAALRRVQAANPKAKKVGVETMRRAIEKIREINEAAMKRMGLVADIFDEERMAYEERRLRIGFHTSAPEDHAVPTDGIGEAIPPLPEGEDDTPLDARAADREPTPTKEKEAKKQRPAGSPRAAPARGNADVPRAHAEGQTGPRSSNGGPKWTISEDD